MVIFESSLIESIVLASADFPELALPGEDEFAVEVAGLEAAEFGLTKLSPLVAAPALELRPV
jgi:hypothetical protein